MRRHRLPNAVRGRFRSLICAKCLAPILILFGALGACAAPAFQTSLDRDNITLGETVTLSLKFTDCNPNGQPELPPIEGLEQTGGRGSSQQMELNGTHLTTSTTYTIELHPARAGSFTIPALQITLKGTRLSSQPVTFNVTKGSAAQPGGAPPQAFVRLVVPDKPFYLGQVIAVEIQCYCQAAQQVQTPQLGGDGFNVGTVPPPVQQPPPQVNVNNTVYNFLDFHAAVTPVKTGVLTLGPATWSLVLLTTRQDSFFPFGFRETHPVTVSSDPAQIHVLAVPTNAPPGFGGALGNFSLAQYEAGPTNVVVGDPVTVKVRIAGKGAFDTVSLSADTLGWREFKTYPPASKLDSSDPAQIEGSKYFEQVITPLNAEIKEIPPFSFVYFDPGAGAFRTLSRPAIPLAVHPASGVAQPTVVSVATPGAESPPAAQEIVHIKEHLGMLETVAPPLIERPWFLIPLGLAPLAWICALLWRRRKEKLANNPRLRRQREVARRVNEGLKQLSAQAAANSAPEFYATVFRLLQEQLGERLDLPASAITEAAVQEAQNRGLRGETGKLLRELFQVCNQYRYAPEHSSQELASVIPKLQNVLRELRNMTPATPATPAPVLQSIGCLLLLFFAAPNLRAQSPADAFDQANKFYEQGKYAEAAADYQKMINAGNIAAALYFNLGNAWFKAGQTGRAIFAYRRAEALSPRDPDIRANLQFARNQVAGGPLAPGRPWTRWLERLTLNEWTLAQAAAFVFLFLVLTTRQIWPRLRKSGPGLPVSLAAICTALTGCVVLSAQERLGEQPAVVIVPEAVARLGPLEEAQSAFTVRDGAELIVLDQKGDWLEVSDTAKRIGWLPQKEVIR